MKAEQAADAGVISEPTTAAAETASTAVTPETETATTSTSLMEKLGIPLDIQKELQSKTKRPEPEPITPSEPEAPHGTEETEPEPTPETPPEENPEEEKPVAEKDQWPESAQKRVDKLSRQKNEWKEKAEDAVAEAAQLKAQLDGVQPVTVAASSSDLLADVQTPEQLQAVIDRARLKRDYCRQHPNGVTVNEGKADATFIEPEEIAKELSEAEDVLMFEVPRKNREIQERARVDEIALKVYPDIFDRGSEDYQVAGALLRTLPGLVNHPARNLVIGDYLRGVKARIAENTKANGKVKPVLPEVEAITRPRAPLAPNVPTAQRGSNGLEPSPKKVDDAMNKLAQSDGSAEAIAAALRARREARTKTVTPRTPVLV